MSIIEGLRNWLKTYDELSSERLNVDVLPPAIGSFGIIPDGSVEELDSFFLARRRRRSFDLVAEMAWGEDIAQNLENLSWYDDFSGWVFEQNVVGNLPDLGDKLTCIAVTDVTAGAVAQVTENGKAQYNITLSIDYTESLI